MEVSALIRPRPALPWALPQSNPSSPIPWSVLSSQRLTVTLLIPTLNEIDGMRVIMPQVQPQWVDQILILDGGSTDGTVEWARSQGYEVLLQKEPGIRQGYMEALPHIRGEVIL